MSSKKELIYSAITIQKGLDGGAGYMGQKTELYCLNPSERPFPRPRKSHWVKVIFIFASIGLRVNPFRIAPQGRFWTLPLLPFSSVQPRMHGWHTCAWRDHMSWIRFRKGTFLHSSTNIVFLITCQAPFCLWQEIWLLQVDLLLKTAVFAWDVKSFKMLSYWRKWWWWKDLWKI